MFEEDLQRAKEVRLLSYMLSGGYNLVKVGRFYSLKEHDSFRLDPISNNFFWNSRGISGDVITFVMEFENKSFLEAVAHLNNKTLEEVRKNDYIEKKAKKEKSSEYKGAIETPIKNINNKRAFRYLSEIRKIDDEILCNLFDKGLIYENIKGSVTFIGKDLNDKIKYASSRGISANSNFKVDAKNSDKNYCFNIKNTKSDTVYVFESPIDVLSHATINKMLKRNWQDINRISLGGTSDKALERFLEENKQIKKIVLFLDNDDAGIDGAKKIHNKYKNDYEFQGILCKAGKDVNETLIKIKEDLKNKGSLSIKNYFERAYYSEDFKFKIPKNLIEIEFAKEVVKNHLLKFYDEKAYDMITFFEDAFDRNSFGITNDNEAVLFIRGDSSDEIIGGYKFDFDVPFNFNVELLENSKSKVFKILENSENKDKNKIYISDDLNILITMNHFRYDIIYSKDLDGIIEAVEDTKKNYNYEEISVCINEENKSIYEKIDFSKYENVKINFISPKKCAELFLKYEMLQFSYNFEEVEI